MRKIRCALFLMVAALFVAAPAAADYGHRYYRHHLYGWGWWSWPYSYYPAYPVPPIIIERAPIIIERQPPVYLERQLQQYWYWCPNPQGYHPYIEQCPSGWMKVVPSAPGR